MDENLVSDKEMLDFWTKAGKESALMQDGENCSAICAYSGRVHVYEGVGALAKEAETEVKYGTTDIEEHPIVATFEHDGVAFFQIMTQKEYEQQISKEEQND